MTDRPFDWTDVLGQHRVIAIHAPILEWAKDYHAAALFEELVWRWNAADRQPFTVTDAELMAKLYMTRGALRVARARLAELKAVTTVKRGIPPVLHYTVHLDAFENAQAAPVGSTLVQIQPNDDAESAQRVAEIEPTYIPESVHSNGHTQSPDTVANDAPGEVDQLPPPKHDSWLPLKLAIATTTTGKPKVTGAKGAPAKWIGEIVGDVGKLSGGDPETALVIWSAFEGTLTDDDREKYINPGNVGQRFVKWSLNGGAGTIRGVMSRRERDTSGEPRELPDWIAA